jgi:hypothetical protein
MSEKPGELVQAPNIDAQTDKLIEEGRISDTYFNGFTVSIGAGDVRIILLRNNKPVANVQTSYTLAKTLAESLTQIVQLLEERTGSTIMTTHFISQQLSDEVEQ